MAKIFGITTVGIQSHHSSDKMDDAQLRELEEGQEKLYQKLQTEIVKRDAAELKFQEQLDEIQTGMNTNFKRLSNILDAIQRQLISVIEDNSILGDPPSGFGFSSEVKRIDKDDVVFVAEDASGEVLGIQGKDTLEQEENVKHWEDSMDVTNENLVLQTQQVFDEITERETVLWNEGYRESKTYELFTHQNTTLVCSSIYCIRNICRKTKELDREPPKSSVQLVSHEGEGALGLEQTNPVLKILQRFEVMLDIKKVSENSVLFPKIRVSDLGFIAWEVPTYDIVSGFLLSLTVHLPLYGVDMSCVLQSTGARLLTFSLGLVTTMVGVPVDFFLVCARLFGQNGLKNTIALMERRVEPTWPKLVEPLERIVNLMAVVWDAISYLKAVKDNDYLRSAIEEIQPEKVTLELKLGQSKPIYNAVKAIRESPDWEKLSDAHKWIVEAQIKEVVLNGIALEDDKREEFNKIEQELAKLPQKFGENVLDSIKKFEKLITDKKNIEGLSATALGLAAQTIVSKGHENATAENGPWIITLDAPSFMVVMQHAKNRASHEEELRPYFSLPKVMDGLFCLANKLFGINVEPADGLAPVWISDVQFYWVNDSSGSPISYFYFDPYSHPSEKRGGAWIDEVVGQSRIMSQDGSSPRLLIAHMVCNQMPHVGDKPSPMTFHEVETVFHEFGHALQQMLTRQERSTVVGEKCVLPFSISGSKSVEVFFVVCVSRVPDIFGKAVNNVNSIIGPALIGKNPAEQTANDNFMVQQLDGTQNEWGWCKQKLGANAILVVSFTVCKAGAAALNIPLYKHIANLAGNKKIVLPVPAFNVIKSGSHAGNKLAMQEILPVGASSFKEAMEMGVEVYHHFKAVIKKMYGQDATNIGDKGGFSPNIQENKEELELLKAAVAKAGYEGKVVIGMDVAASEFYGKDKTYDLNFKEENNDGSQKTSGDKLKDLYKSFVSVYPIVSIEDPFDQDDSETYAKLTAEIGAEVQIMGDDLFVTNPKRVEKAINEKEFITIKKISILILGDKDQKMGTEMLCTLEVIDEEWEQLTKTYESSWRSGSITIPNYCWGCFCY
ncbi:Enolase [Perilla frutescens var. frutescens]|nr:Enolase [Perilla frutescens var. frutescens]